MRLIKSFHRVKGDHIIEIEFNRGHFAEAFGLDVRFDKLEIEGDFSIPYREALELMNKWNKQLDGYIYFI